MKPEKILLEQFRILAAAQPDNAKLQDVVKHLETNGPVNMVEVLRDAGLIAVHEQEGSFSPIQEAFMKAHTSTLETREDILLEEIKAIVPEDPGELFRAWPGFDVTPLHEAACSGYAKVTAYLLQMGANRNARNSMRETASERCRALGKLDISDMIEARGPMCNCSIMRGSCEIHSTLESVSQCEDCESDQE